MPVTSTAGREKVGNSAASASLSKERRPIQHAKQDILSAETISHEHHPTNKKTVVADAKNHPTPEGDISKTVVTDEVECDPKSETGKLSCGAKEYCKETWKGGYCASLDEEEESTISTGVVSARRLDRRNRHRRTPPSTAESNHHPTPTEDIAKTIVIDKVECDPRSETGKLSCGVNEYCQSTRGGTGYCVSLEKEKAIPTRTTTTVTLGRTRRLSGHHRFESDHLFKTVNPEKVKCDSKSEEGKLSCGPMEYCQKSWWGDDYCTPNTATAITSSSQRQLQQASSATSTTKFYTTCTSISLATVTAVLSLYLV